MTTGLKARQITLLGLLTAILLLMSFTPLGYLHVGPLALTLNMIPVAVAAACLGPVGGIVTGTVFGLTSFLQAMGIGGGSPLGTALFSLSPLRCFFMCVGPRVLTGLLTGLSGRLVPHRVMPYFAGLCAAFFNTALFMGAMILLYGSTDYVRAMIAGRNLFVFVCTFVGFQAITEMVASTAITGVIVRGLERARMLER